MLTSLHSVLYGVVLQENTYTFGRCSADGAISLANLPEAKFVSRYHFVIERDIRSLRERPPVYIADHSVNGTLVNGELIGPGDMRILKSGDIISVNNTKAYRFIDLLHETNGFPDHITDNEPIGRGGFGEVFLARDYVACAKSAIKKIEKNPLCVNEAVLMRNLMHPCIVKMIDSYDTETVQYVYMEFLSGGSLQDRLDDGVFGEHLSKFFFYQLAKAVEYLHGCSLAHRDTKPSNIVSIRCE